ncbi:MAG: hypothetical protein NC816_02015 [Candidatus Omnitrophica bacterium]|nr:hypothetical protein [Candidatus Omnitrophota bacterium]MCM8808969.1 hypothetical protein [Candidatus Omnitrophota bacterium]MCM8810746.1 hypothetical protein [Candidatus Omnitrophota bacterium]MCM8832685.1 hypothetical protein [Candidatus Omnitrophota bacterium]
MSISALEIVKEFLTLSNFYVILKNGFLIVKNSERVNREINDFVIEKEKIVFIDKGIIKVISWHTLKFTPSVIKKFSSEIFEIVEESVYKELETFFEKEKYKKILVIPGLPATTSLKNESIKIMKEKGIDHIILFSTIISGLINKIDERKLYQSHTLETIRILKFYKFLSDKSFNTFLFDEK